MKNNKDKTSGFTLTKLLTIIIIAAVVVIIALIVISIMFGEKTYNMGQKVTLKDGSVWYVIEKSEGSSDTVTLFASQNMKNDGSGWTTKQDEYKTAFDEANVRTTEDNSYCTTPKFGCNMYESNKTTVTSDSTIKTLVDSNVKDYINNSLKNNNGTEIDSIRLITNKEICNIIDASDASNKCNQSPKTDVAMNKIYKKVPNWLYSTSYWTMTATGSYGYGVSTIDTTSNLMAINASDNETFGIRPVIVTKKSNIK